MLSEGRNRLVVDATGLKGSYYYTIRSEWTLLTRLFGIESRGSNLPPLGTALEEQLGLKLEFRRGPIQVLVVDSLQHPTQN